MPKRPIVAIWIISRLLVSGIVWRTTNISSGSQPIFSARSSRDAVASRKIFPAAAKVTSANRWLIDPKNQRVEIYRPSRDVEVLENPATLSGEDVLPGFVLDLQPIISID